MVNYRGIFMLNPGQYPAVRVTLRRINQMFSRIKIVTTSNSNRDVLGMFSDSFKRIRTRNPKTVLPDIVTL
jgi:hypothetical protein